MPATVHHLPIRPRQTLATLCVPDRKSDERLLRVFEQYALTPAEVIEGLQARGRIIKFPGDEPVMGDALACSRPQESVRQDRKSDSPAVPSPASFVSPYLLQPLRTEADARSELNRPRPVKVHSVFQRIISWVRP